MDPPGAQLIVSPYDVEARWSDKRSTTWVGYKVHLTETADDDGPVLITNVETTMATLPDAQALPAIHAGLKRHDLLPDEHLLDAGYVDSEQLVKSQTDDQVMLLGPVPRDSSWQARTEGAFDISCFAIDWDAQRVSCPAGHLSTEWKPTQDRHGKSVIHVEFDQQTCAACPLRSRCTQAQTSGREMTLRPREQHIALQEARKRQTTPEFKAAYARRSGVEGALSQGVRICELRQSRYIAWQKRSYSTSLVRPHSI